MTLQKYIRALIENEAEGKVTFPKALSMFKKLGGKGKFQEAIRYASDNLPIIGIGTSRAVIPIDDDRVLKFAVTKAGIAQNSVEANPRLQSQYGDILAKVYDRAPNNFWIEMDRIYPAETLGDANRWAELMGGNNFGIMARYLSEIWDLHENFERDEEGQRFADALEDLNNWVPPQKEGVATAQIPPFKQVSKSPKMQKVIELMLEFDLPPGDLLPRGGTGKVDSIGFTGDGRPIIADYGLSFDIWEDYYELSPSEIEAYQKVGEEPPRHKELEKF